MERKFLESLGIEKEAIDKIMAENGKDIEAQKALTAAEAQKVTAANDTIKQLQDTVKKRPVPLRRLRPRSADFCITKGRRKSCVAPVSEIHNFKCFGD